MAKTLGNLRTGVRVYLDEAAQTDFLDSEVDRSINYAYHDLASRVMEVYEGFYETTTPFTYAMVANQQEYAVDSSLIKITRVEINFNPSVSGSNPVRAVSSSRDEALLNIGNTAAQGTMWNPGYYIYGSIGSQKIGFIPIPSKSDTGGAKSISVWGIAMPSDLVNSGDDVGIPYADNFCKLLEKEAASILLRKGQQEEKVASLYHTEYLREVREMQTFLKERLSDGVQMIEDYEIDDLDFQTLPPY